MVVPYVYINGLSLNEMVAVLAVADDIISNDGWLCPLNVMT